MQIEVYNMEADESNLTITLEAVCDSFSSLLWDIEYYQCGSFEVYIAANPENLSIFQSGRIVGRDDDSRHFGIIESVQIDTDAENGDYLTVKGRFLMCLLERRIINPTLSITADTAYSDIVRNAVTLNAIQQDNRRIPGLSLGTVSGDCWEQTATLQVSYTNLMEWMYTICDKIGGTANIRLIKDVGETYKMVLDLSEGTHNNKDVLDTITEQYMRDEAAFHAQTADALHGLSTGLSEVSAQAHSHSNKAVLDNITQEMLDDIASIGTVVGQAHWHHNLTTLNSITESHLTRWNEAYTTAMNLTERVGVNEGVFERFKTEILYDMQGAKTSITEINTRLAALEEALSGVETALADIVEVSE